MGIPNLAKYLPEMCMAVPPPGSDLIELAESSGAYLENMLEHLLFNRQCSLVPLTVSAGVKQNFKWCSGHSLSGCLDDDYGPRRRYTAAIICQSLSANEVSRKNLFTSKGGMELREFVRESSLSDPSQVYLTSILKTRALQGGKYKKSWVKEQATVTTIELILTRPKYILALGVKTCEFFFGSKKFKLKSTEGRWIEFEWDLRASEDEAKTEENTYKFYVMPSMSPASLEYERRTEDVERMARTVKGFVTTVNSQISSQLGGGVIAPVMYAADGNETVEYPVIRSESELRWAIDQITANAFSRICAVDAEWQGSHPHNRGSYLRCVQFGWQPGKAVVLSLTDTEGNYTLQDNAGRCGKDIQYKLFQLIREAFIGARTRVAGFYYGADHEWLAYNGLDLMPCYEPAETLESCRTDGGVAVELMYAAIDELGSINLESARSRYTKVYDYFAPFDAYRIEAAAKSKGNAVELARQKAGFGWIPDEHLYPYAGGDADATLQAAISLAKHLDSDRFGNNCWLPYWLALRASPVVCEIMRVGMPFSMRRCAELSIIYGKKANELQAELERQLNWPGVNTDSTNHMLTAIYGNRYASTRDPTTGEPVDVRPFGAKTLNLEPVLNNDKEHSKTWDEIRAAGDEHLNTPSADGKVMGMLINSPDGVLARRKLGPSGEFGVVNIPTPPTMKTIQHLKYVKQVQKNFVSSFYRDNETDEVVFKPKGYPVEVCDDGYIRCIMSQTKETGRWASSRPNLHIMPKKREAAYKDVLGKDYPGYLRTMMQAPEGYVILESDYASAELFVLAIASGDEVLWDHCMRNLLSEDDPRFIDPHANLCVTGFNLRCEPNKTGLESVGKSHLRNVAKCVAAGEYLATSGGLIKVDHFCDDLEVGESKLFNDVELQSLYGTNTTPLVAVENTGKKRCVRIVTSLGGTITTSEDHRHFVLHQDGVTRLQTASQTKPGECLWVSLTSIEPESMSYLPAAVEEALSDGVTLDGFEIDCDLPADLVYLLGVLSSTLNRVTSKDDRCVLTLSDRCTEHGPQVAVSSIINTYWGSEACVVDASHCNKVYVVSRLFISLVRALRSSGWCAVSDLCLTWPSELLASYLRGVIVGNLVGSANSLGVVLDEQSAKVFFLGMQSLGMQCKQETKLGGVCLVTAFCLRSRRFFRDTVSGVCDEPADRYDCTSARIMFVGSRALSVMRKYGRQPDMHLDGYECSFSVEETLDLLGQALSLSVLSDEHRHELSASLYFLRSGMVPVLVSEVVDVGTRSTYDFQTTEEADNLMVVNGVATHNSVIYGWAYGRGALAIQRGAREEGIIVTLDETEALVESLSHNYSKASQYLDMAAARVHEGFLVTPMGRVRRCPDSTDNRKISGYKREFKNAAVQGAVADIVNCAAYNLRRERSARGMSWYFLLQIHDAFLFLVPYNEVVELCNEVIPKAMCRDIPITPFGLDGSRPLNKPPKYMGNNVDLTFKWGESKTKAERDDALWSVGINPDIIERLE